jgi:hypothetical protein
MKVFISWSGKLSEEVASLLSEWLPNAVPGTKTWLSNKDIDKGAIWFSDIATQLKDTSVGIICLTRENSERPWILFEAGALNKGLDKSRVCPLLLDLEDRELSQPLKAFNATKPNKSDMLILCKTINKQNTENAFPDPQLEKFFKKFWRDFESGFTSILKKHGKSKPPRRPEAPEMLEQILETVQTLLNASQSRSLLFDFMSTGSFSPRYAGFEQHGFQMAAEHPPFIPQSTPVQLIAGSMPPSGLSKEDLERIIPGRYKNIPFPSTAQAPKPKPPAADAPPSKTPAG